MVDWDNHRTSDKAVLCMLQLRPEYNGLPIKPECLGLNDSLVQLIALYRMDGGDKYPGEWALGLVPGHSYPRALLDIGWIASGDVVPGQKKGADK